jgi:signal transduction histidine kinase
VSAAWSVARARGSLTARVVVATGALALVVAAVFVTLLVAINHQRNSAALSRHSQEVLVAASELERRVIDLETGERGFIITHEPSLLAPWSAALKAIPDASRDLNRLAAVPEQDARARSITRHIAAYVRDYSVPTVDAARRNDPSVGSVAVIAEGRRRVDVLRTQFRELVAAENRIGGSRERRADEAARLAIIAASVGLAGWLVLIVLYVAYLTRAIVRPVRRAAAMAGQLAEGDLSVRMPETGKAEIGALEQSFNRMASSLEASRAELASSRARVVAAADETRRRIERDLHDGAQQRLVSLALELRGARAGVPPGLTELRAQLSKTARGLNDVVTELQEISRGIHPAILSKGGLGPALKILVRRSVLPIDLELHFGDRRLPEGVEVAAYYVVSEALANAVKHAQASVVQVDISAEDAFLVISIHDDGVGGADARRGSGLVGLQDRVETLGGTIGIASRSGEGTTILARIPIDGNNEPDD